MLVRHHAGPGRPARASAAAGALDVLTFENRRSPGCKLLRTAERLHIGYSAISANRLCLSSPSIRAQSGNRIVRPLQSGIGPDGVRSVALNGVARADLNRPREPTDLRVRWDQLVCRTF